MLPCKQGVPGSSPGVGSVSSQVRGRFALRAQHRSGRDLPTDLPTIGSSSVVQATPEPSGRTSEHVMDALGPNEQSAPVPRSERCAAPREALKPAGEPPSILTSGRSGHSAWGRSRHCWTVLRGGMQLLERRRRSASSLYGSVDCRGCVRGTCGSVVGPRVRARLVLRAEASRAGPSGAVGPHQCRRALARPPPDSPAIRREPTGRTARLPASEAGPVEGA